MDLQIAETGRIFLTFAERSVYIYDQGVGRFRMRTDQHGHSEALTSTQMVFIESPEGTGFSFDQRAQRFIYRVVDDEMEPLPDDIVAIPTEEGYLDFDQRAHRFI